MTFDWSEEKNVKLKQERGVSFEDVLVSLDDEKYTIVEHPNIQKYPGQKIYILPIQDYIYMVPFVDNNEGSIRFLKTIIPSRKMKKMYSF